MIKNYDQEIEKKYHPENFESSDEDKFGDGETCPSCKEEEYRPLLIGNEERGFHRTGDWECDNCEYEDKEPTPL